MSKQTLEERLVRAAQAIASADALLIGAGAGMGVDSGLPDFRGNQGFWNAYPPYAERGLDFVSLANPRWFANDPELAWGFYGHRLELYRETQPHDGFGILLGWARRMDRGCFVYTSNVDGHFQRAGFDPDQVYEVHGSIGSMQCTGGCGVGIFSADPFSIRIDSRSMLAVPPLPRCPSCRAMARPNILMFGDWNWDSSRSDLQRRLLRDWLDTLRGARLVVIECGAGTAVPTVRMACEDLAEKLSGRLVRINPRDPEAPEGAVSIPLSALEGLSLLAERCAQLMA